MQFDQTDPLGKPRQEETHVFGLGWELGEFFLRCYWVKQFIHSCEQDIQYITQYIYIYTGTKICVRKQK